MLLRDFCVMIVLPLEVCVLYCIRSTCYFVVLIVPVPGHCLLVAFSSEHHANMSVK